MATQIQILPSGYQYVIGRTYSVADSQGLVAVVIISFIELVLTVALLAAVLFTALSSHASPERRFFARTTSGALLISLTICVLLQAIGGSMTAGWIRYSGVFAGLLCTAQGAFRHIADVGVGFWSMLIAIHSFLMIWHSQKHLSSTTTTTTKSRFDVGGIMMPVSKFSKWAAVALAWGTITILVFIGPVVTSNDSKGDWYGVSGDWCWITDGYLVERVVFVWSLMIIAGLCCIVLSTGVFVHILKVLDVDPHGSPVTSLSGKDDVTMFAVRLSNFMLWYPLVFFACSVPTLLLRFVYWAGVDIPTGANAFTDSVYHLIGIANAMLYLCMPRLVPPRALLTASLAELIPAPEGSTRGSTRPPSFNRVVNVEGDESKLPPDPATHPPSVVPVVEVPTPVHYESAIAARTKGVHLDAFATATLHEEQQDAEKRRPLSTLVDTSNTSNVAYRVKFATERAQRMSGLPAHPAVFRDARARARTLSTTQPTTTAYPSSMAHEAQSETSMYAPAQLATPSYHVHPLTMTVLGTQTRSWDPPAPPLGESPRRLGRRSSYSDRPIIFSISSLSSFTHHMPYVFATDLPQHGPASAERPTVEGLVVVPPPPRPPLPPPAPSSSFPPSSFPPSRPNLWFPQYRVSRMIDVPLDEEDGRGRRRMTTARVESRSRGYANGGQTGDDGASGIVEVEDDR